MPLHMLRVSLRLLGVQLRRATFQVLVRLATRVEPAFDPLPDDGDPDAPAHWLSDIRAYGQKPHWISFVAPRLQRQDAIPQRRDYPAANLSSQEQIIQRSTSRPVSGNTQQPPSDAQEIGAPRRNEPARQHGRLRFPEKLRPDHTETATVAAQRDRPESVNQPVWPQLAEEPERIRITYANRATRPASTWEHRADGSPAPRSLHVQAIRAGTADRIDNALPGSDSIYVDPGSSPENTGDAHSPIREPAARERAANSAFPSPGNSPPSDLDGDWTGKQATTTQEQSGSEYPGLAAHRWPELPEQNERLARLGAAAEALERHHEEWKHRERLDSEQRGIEWNESPS